MKDILYFNTLEDIRLIDALRISNKDKELPNQIILTIQSAGAGEVTPVFLKSNGDVNFTSIDDIGTKFILDGKEITSDDFQLIEVKVSYFGLQFEDSNEHTLKVSLVDSTINQNTFESNKYLTKVTIGTSITSIGEYAFYECSGLTSVTIPNSVISIGGVTFYGCSGLTSMVVENGNTKYDSRNNCNAIIETESNTLLLGCKNTIIPNSVTTIGNGAFAGCTDLASVTIPSSVTKIGYGAFALCSGLTSVTIGNSVTTIGSNAFADCTGLTSVTIPNSVTTIGSNAFYECSGLTSVTIPNSVTEIGESAFYRCSGLTSVTIPNSVTYIGSSAFEGCKGLTGALIIPNSMTTIGDGAFRWCSGLTSVTIPNSVTMIGSYAFANCTGLNSITSLATTAPTIKSSTFQNIKTNGTLHVPAGSNYSAWMSTSNYYLGKYNWTKVEDA